jgi:hypothetical protein
VESEEVAQGDEVDYDDQGRVIGTELVYVRELLAAGRVGAWAAKPAVAE